MQEPQPTRFPCWMQTAVASWPSGQGLAQVTEKLIHLERLREKFYEGAEPEMIKLVVSIAEKVIGRIAAENPGKPDSAMVSTSGAGLGGSGAVICTSSMYQPTSLTE